jgi:hypothetical protein
MIFVKLAKARRVLLRSLNQKPLVRFFLQSLQRFLRGLSLHKVKVCEQDKGYGRKENYSIPKNTLKGRGAESANKLTLVALCF